MNSTALLRLTWCAALLQVACSTPSTTDAGCPTSYCNSHGACADVKNLPQCTCEPGYEGLTCLTCAAGFHRVGTGSCAPDQECTPTTCGPNGTCAVVRGEVECTCATGYDGPSCELCYGDFVDVSDAGFLDAGVDGGAAQRAGPAICALPVRCNAGSCPSGFDCDDTAGRITCTCEDLSCQGQACTPQTCSGHGVCDASLGTSQCTCEVGYQGSRCEACYFGYRAEVGADGGTLCVPADRCTQTTCSGFGLCGLDGGTAQCRCAAGHEGVSCERCAPGHHRVPSGACEIDQTCAANSCPSNSVCLVQGGVVTCPCATGYAGAGCQQCYPGYHTESRDAGVDAGAAFSCALDQRCTSTSCGLGVCEDATGAVVCSNCPTGFTGAHCEVNLDDCGTACQTGRCVDLIGSRICLCTDGTYGSTCLPGPAVTQVRPAFGPRAGGTLVTLTGTGFVSGTTVTLSGAPVSGVNVLSATSLTFTTPSSTTLGVKDLVVRTPNGQVARTEFAYAPLAFTFTGAVQQFTVPAGVTSLAVQVWGGGGGGGDKPGIRGGAGGYSEGTLRVDAGQVFSVLVGEGGARWFGLTLDGGTVDGGSAAGAGGGLTGLFAALPDGGVSQATALIIAGGGGGGGLFDNVLFGSSGGNGGGDFGGAGAQPGTTSLDARGLGGSVTVGGVGGCSTSSMSQCGQTGLALQGGGGGVQLLSVPRIGATFGGGGGVGRSSAFNAGGGGGGYFGGGGGANQTPQGGGGGSGFLAGSVINGSSVRATVPGVPAQQNAIGYVPGVGVGGHVDGGTSGGNGLVLVGW
ncbi:MAG: hypothetical protein GQE15_38185 [Archangiaceae bacterium]|nr:hypothetical protein [Archangiaceae bacterium]